MGAIDFDQLFSLYSQRLKYIAYSYTKDSFLAEDIVQEAFIKAFKKIETVEDHTKVGAWLAAITARTAMDFLRSEKRKNCLLSDPTLMEQVMGDAAAGSNTEEEVEIRFLRKEIGTEIQQLSKETQTVLVLKHQYGLKENEIASLLHLKSATVKTRLYRARKQLKQVFAEKYSA